MIGRLYGLSRRQARQRSGDLIERLDLAGAAGRLVRTYSGGMRRRLDVAASLLAAPPVLFLDEPTTGLDPRGRLALWHVLGLAVRDPESAGLAGIFPIVILFFTSSTLVPVATMPGWLQAFAKANPITVITGALRALCLGGPTARPALEAAAWLLALLAVTIPAAVTSYRRATSA